MARVAVRHLSSVVSDYFAENSHILWTVIDSQRCTVLSKKTVGWRVAKMSSRFEWVVEGKSSGPNPAYDVDLWSDPRAAVVPTIGAIVPHWYLIVPRRRAPCIRALSRAERIQSLELAREVADRFSGEQRCAAFFEHGAAVANSPVGCGADQAHLHAALLDFDLMGRVLSESPEFSWLPATTDDPWADIPKGTDYYLLLSGGRVLWAEAPRQLSQFFRRHIASGAGLSNQWDYRKWPHLANSRRAGALLGPSSPGQEQRG